MKNLKTLIVILLFFSTIFKTNAQENIWFKDDFTKKSENWKDINSEFSSARTISKSYNIVTNYNKIHETFLSDVYINPDKDFVIELNITQISGSGSKSFGLVWGAKNGNNLYSFSISSSGYFYINEYKNDEIKEIKEKTKSDKINPINKENKLTIKNKESILSFYINDTKVFSQKIKKFKGHKIGFELNGKMNVKVNSITVKQDNEIKLSEDVAKGIEKINLGRSVNSKYAEVVPVITRDGKTLYFYVDGDPHNVGGKQYGDIWYSNLQSDSTWSPRKNIGKPLNNAYPNFVFSVSPDNNTLLLYGQYDKNGDYLNQGISTSHRTAKGWEVPQNIVIDKYNNKSDRNEFCLSPNNKVLISSIETNDTYGDRDLYVSFLKENGEWTEPKNMGAEINSLGSEITPFIAADGVTLYFATNGRPGYGKHDIFVSTRLNEDWTKWSEPENLGDEINTSSWDAYYTIPASAEYAYLSSDRNSLGKQDIFKVKLPQSLKPEPVILVYGKVLNKKTLEPLSANIAYKNLTTNKELGIAISNPKDGSYKLILPIGQEYSFLATKENFISQSESVDAREIKVYTEIERNLYLSPIEVGQIIRLNNIFFDFDKASLREESFPDLNMVVKLMNENKKLKIELRGHTDNKGSDDYNLKLSQKRIDSVKNYLVEHGINSDRLEAKGYGESQPTATNDTEEGRQLNRRIEFKILSK